MMATVTLIRLLLNVVVAAFVAIECSSYLQCQFQNSANRTAAQADKSYILKYDKLPYTLY